MIFFFMILFCTKTNGDGLQLVNAIFDRWKKNFLVVLKRQLNADQKRSSCCLLIFCKVGGSCTQYREVSAVIEVEGGSGVRAVVGKLTLPSTQLSTATTAKCHTYAAPHPPPRCVQEPAHCCEMSSLTPLFPMPPVFPQICCIQKKKIQKKRPTVYLYYLVPLLCSCGGEQRCSLVPICAVYYLQR